MLVSYKEAGIYHVGGFMFRPGVNDVPDSAWFSKKDKTNGIADHPHVIERLKNGSMEVIKSADKPTTKSLSDFDTAGAVKVVSDTLNHELLVSWIKKEERLSVKTAIQSQLRKLDLDDDGKPIDAKKKD